MVSILTWTRTWIFKDKSSKEICEDNVRKVVTALTAVQGVTHIGNIPISYFRPTWGVLVIGYLPFIGNITNFGCAIYMYQYGDHAYATKKMTEALLGLGVDLYTPLGCDRIAIELARRTMARVGCFRLIDYFYYLETPELNKKMQ